MIHSKQDLYDQRYIAWRAQEAAVDTHPVDHWAYDVLSDLAGTVKDDADHLPWQKASELFSMRGGELTIWGGARGTNKSFITGQVAMWLAQRFPVGIASFEMAPKDTITRMIRQAAGTASPSAEYGSEWLSALSKTIHIYDQHTALTPDRVCAIVLHMARIGCKHVFVDSLMKCGLSTDDYTGQRDFVNQLTQMAKRLDIHVHLVAHVRKKGSHQSYDTSLTCDDIAGGADITNLAHHVILVIRDAEVRDLHRRVEQGYEPEGEDEGILDKPTHYLKVDKSRTQADGHTIALWAHPSMQFLPKKDHRAMLYPNINTDWGRSIQSLGDLGHVLTTTYPHTLEELEAKHGAD